MQSSPTGVVTLAFTDIEGSSELSEQYGSAFEPLRTEHYRLLREAAARWNGIDVESAGDSLFVVFTSTADAVRWALDAQRALLSHDWGGLPLRVRIGLHTGEPFFGDSGEPFACHGPPVNRAARVMDAAHGGQVLLSHATQVLVAADLPPEFAFRDCGVHRLKGVGEERLWQLVHPDLPGEFPPLRALHPYRHNLPLASTPFMGREAQIEEWLELLARPGIRLLTLVGPGGVGKTRAALHLAELSTGDYADGVWYIGLEECRAGREIYGSIAGYLHIPLSTLTPVQQQVTHFLQNRELLLVLDNVEQIIDAAGVVHGLLSACPGTKCLVTTRLTLDLRSETVVEVPPLPAGDAERLFVERARARSPAFNVSPANAADIAELCRRLEGVPLAIELAAARTGGMAPRQMIQRLGERFRLLQSQIPDLPARQRALRTAIDWSHCLLDAEEQSVFAQLSAFTGGFSLVDAEAVCEGADVFESVMRLRRHSLFRAETDAASQETRFSMLDSVREYAKERLLATDDSGRAVQQRHAEYFLDFARQRTAAFRTTCEAEALRELETAGANLRGAIDWARRERQAALLAGLALVIGVTLYRRGFSREAAGAIEEGLAAALPLKDQDPALYARLLWERAGLHLDNQDAVEARRSAAEALELFVLLGDPDGRAQAENLLGQAAMAERCFGEARALFSGALAHYEGRCDQTSAAIVRHNLGLVERRDSEGDPKAAERHLEEALRLRRALGDRRGIAESLNGLGVLAHFARDWAAARACYQEAMELELELGHVLGVATALDNLGEVAVEEGEPERASRLLAASERLMHEIESPHLEYVTRQLVSAAERAHLGPEAMEALRRDAAAAPLDELVVWATQA